MQSTSSSDRSMQLEAQSGFVLLAAAVIAIILANSPWSAQFAQFWQTLLGFDIAGVGLWKSIVLWINDGLMAVFFFVMGLEIKRELHFGSLKDPRSMALAIVAAIGGMVTPALIYVAIMRGAPGIHGWAIPTATDIAFAIGFLSILGPRVPREVKVLLLALAIIDDIGATAIIALVYSHDLTLMMLALGILGLFLVFLLRRLGFTTLAIYLPLAFAIWLAFLKSGVHPTVAAVAFAMLMPVTASEQAPTAIARLEQWLHPWVAFGIMPLFALANAGVTIRWAEFAQPITLAVIAGLVIGKPVGVIGVSWLAVRIGFARLANPINPFAIVGVSCLAGIGFTMSLFIASLALRGAQLEQAKLGIMIGSSVSALLGVSILARFLSAPRAS
ncbi:MAG: Na+/H+ antiporter NhaA [Gemmataceae bacterium]